MDGQDAAIALVMLGVAAGVIVAGAVATVVVVHLAGIGRLRRNHLAGIRTPSLMASDDAWVRGHRAATPITWLTGAIAALAGLGALVAVASGSPEGASVLIALASIAIILGVVMGAWRARATVR